MDDISTSSYSEATGSYGYRSPRYRSTSSSFYVSSSKRTTIPTGKRRSHTTLVSKALSSGMAAMTSRMKVGIRCRPPFKEEIESSRGDFMSIIETKPAGGDNEDSGLSTVTLTLMSGRQRDFLFDYALGADVTQDYVYTTVAKPVVNDVLKGFNGTIFAYGQTGTGKTYTMGILEYIKDEHAGIIPRSLSQVFDAVDDLTLDDDDNDSIITIKLSFLQIYRESIQDLFANNNNNNNSSNDDNLAIREDPQKGFYVEGLNEFVVRSYNDAEGLINIGLQNRAIASTVMNATSSRSHTILTLSIEKRKIVAASSANATSTIRSKLVMVDLAGSERVRRSVSKGARLSEAKSINTSLSALGNVIAALADPISAHIPYRDSKLTRLLQDSLGGTASTALIATVGPAAINYGETLSTLQFATRCMAVKSTPVLHEEVDYAEMCARLQTQVSQIQGQMTEQMLTQQSKYEQTIASLRGQLGMSNSFQAPLLTHALVIGRYTDGIVDDSNLNSNSGRSSPTGIYKSPSFSGIVYNNFLKFISGGDSGAHESKEWLYTENKEMVAILAYCYEVFQIMTNATKDTLEINNQRESELNKQLSVKLKDELYYEELRNKEKERMSMNDPTSNNKSHLAPLSTVEAMSRVETIYASNNAQVGKLSNISVKPVTSTITKPFMEYDNLVELAKSISSMYNTVQKNMEAISVILARKDEHFKVLKEDLTEQLVERRRREEEVINWSYILRYLLETTSNLRKHINIKETPIKSTQGSREALSMIPSRKQRVLNTRSNITRDNNTVTARAIAHNTDGIAAASAEIVVDNDVDSVDNDHDIAREIVETLGVDDQHADAAMNVINKIMCMTPAQLEKLDPETQQQVMQVRRELGL